MTLQAECYFEHQHHNDEIGTIVINELNEIKFLWGGIGALQEKPDPQTPGLLQLPAYRYGGLWDQQLGAEEIRCRVYICPSFDMIDRWYHIYIMHADRAIEGSCLVFSEVEAECF